jgi:hypothetical protein
MDATTSGTHCTNSAHADALDEPYRFGRRPSSRAPFPFTERQYMRLLVLRGRFESLAADDEQEAA